jgi:hypothetical protein
MAVLTRSRRGGRGAFDRLRLAAGSTDLDPTRLGPLGHRNAWTLDTLLPVVVASGPEIPGSLFSDTSYSSSFVDASGARLPPR